MSYAIRNDGQGWRTVDSPDDIGVDERYSIDTPPDPVPLPLSVEELAATERTYRDQELAGVAWFRDRHRDQLEIELEPTLSGAQFTELLVYIQALRDWPQSSDFPDSQYRPTEPPWLAEQTQ